jgi:hypothetical protein
MRLMSIREKGTVGSWDIYGIDVGLGCMVSSWNYPRGNLQEPRPPEWVLIIIRMIK